MKRTNFALACAFSVIVAAGAAATPHLQMWAQNAATPAARRQAITVDPKILEGYAGRYQLSPTVVVRVFVDGGRTFTETGRQGVVEIFPSSPQEFFAKQGDGQWTFHTDAQGQATEVVVHQRGRDTVAKRIAEATAASLGSQLTAIDAMVAAEFAKRPVGSITVGVVSGSRLIWTKSYGDADMENKIPADENTVYRIGSITKMFTALMLEQLVEAGKVHFSDAADKYFPAVDTVQDRFPGAPPVTLIELATHTAGLGREPDNTDTYVEGPVADWEKTLIAALPHTHYQYEPGTHYSYSNIGFAILGAALSQAAGEPYLDYVPEHIFAPLGMTHSALVVNANILPHLSKGYQVRGDVVDSATPQREWEGRGYKVPNGTIFTTVGDLSRFASFLMGDGPGTVLPVATLEKNQAELIVPADADLATGYGLGFMVQRRVNYTAFGHGGSVAGYNAGLYVNRNTEIGVIALTNVGGTSLDPDSLALRALDILSQ